MEVQSAAVRDSVLQSFQTSAVTAQLHAFEDSCRQDFLHDIVQVHHYLQLSNKGAAAANLGIYMSDLGYLIKCRQKALVQQYFDGCFLLANYVGMEKQFSHAIELRFAEIISGNEAVEKFLDPLFKDATNTSSGEEFKKMHGAALTGYYVEELYHLARFAQAHTKMEHSDRLALRDGLYMLIEQRNELGYLIDYFDHVKLKPEGNAVYRELLTMQREYQMLDRMRWLHEDDPALILQDMHLKNIVDQIILIRAKIVAF